MKNLRRKAILILAFIFLIGSIEHTYPSQSFCSSTANYERIYNIQVSIGIFRFTHRLYVSVTPSLYEFYRSQNHRLTGYIAYQKFVTPEVVKPIAESIWHIIPNCSRSDELFANAVLTLFQQFRYAQSNVKYPIETIVNGSGDCDVFSVLAASIMKAGGLDVILLYYKDAEVRHMNVGVYLSHIPAQCGLWSPPTYYEYKEKNTGCVNVHLKMD